MEEGMRTAENRGSNRKSLNITTSYAIENEKQHK